MAKTFYAILPAHAEAELGRENAVIFGNAVNWSFQAGIVLKGEDPGNIKLLSDSIEEAREQQNPDVVVQVLKITVEDYVDDTDR